MPATTLFGRPLRQLAADNTLFYFMIAVVQVVWLFIYWIGIAAFAQPQTCDPGTRSGGQQWAATFVCLALFIAQAAVTLGAVFVTLRGTPLEPETKRRWIRPLSYAFLASLPVNAGVLAWADWVVRSSDGSCWSSGDRAMPTSIFFGGLGVLLGQAVGVAVSYNQLGDVRHGNGWHSRTRTGVSSLIHLCASWRAQHRGPSTVLEEIVTELQRLMAGIQADKTDVVAGLACAALLQEEASAKAVGQIAAADSEAAGEARRECEGTGMVETGTSAALGDGSKASSSGSKPASASASSAHAELLAWAEAVCAHAAAALPAAGGVDAAHSSPASAAAAAATLRWARYATSAYGARQLLWRRGHQGGWAASRQLRALAAAAASQGAAPTAGWGTPKGTPRKEVMQDFAAARELLGAGSCEIVWFCSGREAPGLLPHLVAVDREQQAVVLGIAGNWRQPHAVPEMQTALPTWLAGCSTTSGAAAEAGLGAGSCSSSNGAAAGASWVHKDSLEAAEALAAELERSQVLHRLLHPHKHGSNGSNAGGTGAAAGGGAISSPGAASGLDGLDCMGWKVVVAGHGLGAGAAALLAPRLHSWQLGPLAVWAYAPPAQLCSDDIAAALSSCCSVTSVVVGDDASPRATSAALRRLVEQAVVGLARLRFSKFGLFAALVAEQLRPARWQRRWCRHDRALRPLCDVAPEALAFLQRFRDWQAEQVQLEQGRAMRQPGTLPGRVLWLSRPGAEAAGAGLDPAATGGSSTADSSHEATAAEAGWGATWVDGEVVAGWNIRVSRHVLPDHYVSRLLGVLGDVAAVQP